MAIAVVCCSMTFEKAAGLLVGCGRGSLPSVVMRREFRAV
jgi:hypothetical protein